MVIWKGVMSDAKTLLVFVKTDVKSNEKYYEEHILEQIKAIDTKVLQ